MSAATTTIRLPDELKSRIASAAERAGKTTHSFIIEAITEKAELEERRAGFEAEADARFSKIVETGKTVAWNDVREYLQQRVSGQSPARPAVKTRQA
jgi:predicted transcriptional regulator